MKFIRYISIFTLIALALFAEDTPNCLIFKDNDDYVLLDDEPLHFVSRFTIECWFNVHEFADSAALIDFSTLNFIPNRYYGYGIYTLDNNKLAIRMGNSSQSFELIIDSLKTHVWQHLAVTYDKLKNDENVTVFLNGKIIEKADCNVYLDYPETFIPYGVVLGAFYDHPYVKAFKGELDDVRFWSAIRTNEEIRDNMDRTIDPETSGLEGYYTFDQDADSLLYDSSPNGNHGMLQNMEADAWQASYAQLAVSQPVDISFNRLVLSWIANPSFTSHCIDLSLTPDFSESCPGFPVYDVKTSYYILNNIEPGTYYYRVKGHYDGKDIAVEPWTDIQAVSTITDAPTSIELSDFTVTQDKETVLIQWETASQSENSAFLLERQANEEPWLELYRTEGAGTQTGTRSYAYTDRSVIAGNHYAYRLKDISYAGDINESGILDIDINVSDSPEFELRTLFPNPFNPSTSVSFDIRETARVVMAIYNVQGEIVRHISDREYQPGHYDMQIAPGAIPSGVYLLCIRTPGNVQTHKLLYLK